jgi:hypothetical protein
VGFCHNRSCSRRRGGSRNWRYGKYALVKEYIGVDQPYDVKTAYTNEFLDRSIKMTK